MITLVNIETAKLLKQKGFNQPTTAYTQKSTVIGNETILPVMFKRGRAYDWNNHPSEIPYYSVPTIVEAVMWIYETYGIWIEVIETDLFNKFFFQIKRKDNTRLKNGDFNSPTEAYESAIKFTLERLI